jgi:hypothetical protein
MTNQNNLLTLIFCLILTLTACQSGAVIFEPTPLPPDQSPLLYQHPSGAFRISVPQDWILHEQINAQLASVTFTPPNASAPALTVGVIQLADHWETLPLIEQYQTVIRPNADGYDEQDRILMPDGSWRIVGLREVAGGLHQPVNTFFQRIDNLIAVVEIRLMNDPTRLHELETAVNTLQLNPDHRLDPTAIEMLGFISPADVQVIEFNAWTTAQNVYYVAGSVRNTTPDDLAHVPVLVSLTNDQGETIISAFDDTMGYSLPSGGTAPFSVRFGEGQPNEATRFQITVGAGTPLTRQVNHDGLQWQEREIALTDNGHQIITGEIVNQSGVTLYDPQLIVTVFGAGDVIIGTGFITFHDGAFEPEASAPVIMRIQDLSGTPTSTLLTLQGYIE